MLKHPRKFRLPTLEGQLPLSKMRNFLGIPLVVSGRACERQIHSPRGRNAADHVRRFFRDHHDRSVRVATHHTREYGCVHHPERFHPVDTELLIHDGVVVATHTTGAAGVVHCRGGLYPQSRGRVRLAGSNPLAAPLVDPRLLSHPDDVAMMRRGTPLGQP